MALILFTIISQRYECFVDVQIKTKIFLLKWKKWLSFGVKPFTGGMVSIKKRIQ